MYDNRILSNADAGDLLATSDFISDEPPFVQDWILSCVGALLPVHFCNSFRSYGVPGLANKADAAAAASVVRRALQLFYSYNTLTRPWLVRLAAAQGRV